MTLDRVCQELGHIMNMVSVEWSPYIWMIWHSYISVWLNSYLQKWTFLIKLVTRRPVLSVTPFWKLPLTDDTQSSPNSHWFSPLGFKAKVDSLICRSVHFIGSLRFTSSATSTEQLTPYSNLFKSLINNNTHAYSVSILRELWPIWT